MIAPRTRRRPPGTARAILAAGVGVVLGLALAACGGGPTPAPASPRPSLSATDSPAAATTAPPSSGGPSAGATPAATQVLPIDPTLLGVLPSAVDGIPFTENAAAEAAADIDPQLATVGTAMAAGVAVDAGTGEFVYAVVVRLRAGAMDDTVFRDWRDSYDEGACSQASGVAGHAQAAVNGHTVYVGTCTGGLRTYHVWLAGSGLLVSASAAGARPFGEVLMNGIIAP